MAAVYVPEHKLCTLRTFEESKEGGKKKEEGREGGKEGAYACLKGKHVVFVGDSVTRYQYLSLVSFLEKGGWEEEEKQERVRKKGGREEGMGVCLITKRDFSVSFVSLPSLPSLPPSLPSRASPITKAGARGTSTTTSPPAP